MCEAARPIAEWQRQISFADLATRFFMADQTQTPVPMSNLINDHGSPPHDSSITHVTGKSEYVDDRPMLKGELHCGLVYSPYAHARVVRLDTAPALKIPGVICAVTSKDVAHNIWGVFFRINQSSQLMRFIMLARLSPWSAQKPRKRSQGFGSCHRRVGKIA